MPRDTGPSGVLLLDKPAGITSTRALAMAKRALGSLKGGHTGTLDPFATGLLPLVFGEATKFSRFLLDATKSYEATLRLGETTASGDTETPVVARSAVNVDSGKITEVIRIFLGVRDQIPPMHSAVRVGGRRLYEYAREGAEVDRAGRTVEISQLEATGMTGNDLSIRVTCSKGTYVRTLGEEIGAALGCGAHLVALRRTQVGRLRIQDATTLEELKAMETAQARGRLLPVDTLVADLPRVETTPGETDDFVHGRVVRRVLDDPGPVAVFDPAGRFLGVAAASGDRGLVPLRLMADGSQKAPDLLELKAVSALK